MSEKSLTPIAIVAVITTAALTLAACSNAPTNNTTASTNGTETSEQTSAAESTSAETSTQAPTTSSTASSSDSAANTAMKTAAAQAPDKLVPTGMIVGNQDDYDEVVIQFSGSGTPGWFSDYVDNPTQQGSGKPIEVPGENAISVLVEGVVLPFEAGVENPTINPIPSIGPAISEVHYDGTFEGKAQFVIGLKGDKLPYSIRTESNPTRLIINVQHKD
ncbi:MAG: hypothetical protein Q4A82_00820 [Corynebacterium sp.]|nr:hypothetical protein [Corynebacterium sp.]